MEKHYDIFLEAIHLKRLLKIKFNSKEKGIIERTCVPFDFGPSRRSKDGFDKFHLYDLDSPDGKHTLSILPEQLLEIELLNIEFNPADYITWSPINWFTKRDWGKFS